MTDGESLVPREWGAGFLVDGENSDIEIRPGGEIWDLTLDAVDPRNQQTTQLGVRFSQRALTRLYGDLPRTFESDRGLPVLRLFKTGTQRELIHVVFEEMRRESYDVSLRDVKDRVTVSDSAVDNNWSRLRDFGVVEAENPDANIPHYGLGDTRPVKLLQSWEGIPLTEFFESPGQGVHKLVQFFLVHADPEEWYSETGLVNADRNAAARDAVRDNIGTLADTGFVLTKPGTRADTVYQVNLRSSLRRHLLDLNEALRWEYDPTRTADAAE